MSERQPVDLDLVQQATPRFYLAAVEINWQQRDTICQWPENEATSIVFVRDFWVAYQIITDILPRVV